MTLTLFTNHLSPNGLKVSIYLEELGLKYSLKRVDVPNNEQKSDWFIKLNPNGRIPVLIDHDRGDFAVFESAAILLYLSQHFDDEKKLSFDPVKNPEEYSQMLQWIFFAHGGVGPTQGQTHYFLNYSPEDVPFAKKRFHEETKRLYNVLDIGLKDRDYLVGKDRGVYTIADMNVYPWIRLHQRAGCENLKEWPDLEAWYERIKARPGIAAALNSVAL